MRVTNGDTCKSDSFVYTRKGGGCGEEYGAGGLAAAVTSSFMNSLYFCSVQNKRTFLLKKMTKKKEQDHLSRLLSSRPPRLRLKQPRSDSTTFRFGWSYRISRRPNEVSIARHGRPIANFSYLHDRRSNLISGFPRNSNSWDEVLSAGWPLQP